MPANSSLLRTAKALSVESNFAFLPRDSITFCNCYATCFVAARGGVLPPLLANLQHAWLADPANGWRKVDTIEAASLADDGATVLAVWTNPTGGHGHIAVVLGSDDGHLLVSAAGQRNYVCTQLERSFGLTIHPEFFTHA